MVQATGDITVRDLMPLVEDAHTDAAEVRIRAEDSPDEALRRAAFRLQHRLADIVTALRDIATRELPRE